MGPLAFLATPGVGTAIGAGLQGFLGWFASRRQSKAARSAAQIQADAARQAGEWQRLTAEEQLKFQREESDRLAKEFERAQEANWAMERAREERALNQAYDDTYNQFGLGRWQGRLGFEDTAANRSNARAELLASLRTGQGRHAATQRRLGRLGQLVGTPQPVGGREIAPLVEPTALQQPAWVALDDPRQTPFTYPEYVKPRTA